MATAATAEKPVKTPKEPKAPKVKKEKTPKVDFKTVIAGTQLTPGGLLNTASVIEAGYDPKAHSRLTRKDFAEEFLFSQYKGHEMIAHGKKLMADGEQMIKNADTIKQFGDPKNRSKAKRAQKLAESLGELTKQLKAQGIDIEALLANVGK